MLKRDKGTNLFATNNTLRTFFQLFVQLSGGNAAEHQPTTPHPGARPRPSPRTGVKRRRKTLPNREAPSVTKGSEVKSRRALRNTNCFRIFALRSGHPSGRDRAHSSVGQSSGLIIRRSWDHAPLGPPVNPAANSFAAGFLFFTGGRGFSRFFRIFAGKQKKQRLWNSKVPCTK